MTRFRLDTTKSPPVVIDTHDGSILTIDEVYNRRWETPSLTEGTELTYVLCEVEQHAWGKVLRHHTKEIT